MDNQGYKCRITSDITDIKEGWASLQESCIDYAFFHDWRWNSALAEHLFPGEIVFVSVEFGEELVAVMPVTYDKSRKKVSIPFCDHTDLSDVVVHREHCNSELLSVLMVGISKRFPGWREIQMPRCLGSSAAIKLFSEYAGLKHGLTWGRNFRFRVRSAEMSDVLPKKQLKNVARLKRKLVQHEDGDVAYIDGLEAQSAVPQFFGIERLSWKGIQTNTCVSASDQLTKFYSAVATLFAADDGLVMRFIKKGDRYIAGQFALRVQETVYMLKIAYIDELKAFGPGTILFVDFIDESRAHFGCVNMVTGPAWAERWNPDAETVSWLRIYNYNPMGLFGFISIHMKDYLRPVKSWLFSNLAKKK